jgi:hypothetical protein
MNKETAFIKGYSLKKGDDEVHDLLRRPRRAGLKTFGCRSFESTKDPFISSCYRIL